MTLTEIYGNIESDLSQVEEYLEVALASPNRLVQDLNAYFLRTKGKRVRPALVLLASRIGRAIPDQALRLSCAIELIHMATLVHDDVVDAADVRRGRKTVHVLWGNPVAVLYGDFMWTKSLASVADFASPALTTSLCRAVARMTEGELTQITQRNNLSLTQTDYIDIIERKTASLMATACEAGGIIADLPSSQTERLREFGRYFGLAFQIVDDTLDYAGTAEAFGKPIGHDIREKKMTLPVIHAIETFRGEDRTALFAILEKPSLEMQDVEALVALLRHNGCLDASLDHARRFAAQALDCLADLPPSPSLASLRALTGYVTARDR